MCPWQQENMKRYPEEFRQIIEIAQRIGHTWKVKKALGEF